MKWGLILSLGVGVGWIIGATLAMVFSQLSGIMPTQGILESLGNTFTLGFPGFLLLIISIIIILRDDFDEEKYGWKEQF